MSREYKYFISYNFDTGQGMGMSNCVATLDKPIETFKDIQNVEDNIKKTIRGCTKVLIINYIKFP